MTYETVDELNAAARPALEEKLSSDGYVTGADIMKAVFGPDFYVTEREYTFGVVAPDQMCELNVKGETEDVARGHSQGHV